MLNMLMKCFLVVFVEFSKHYFAVKKLYSVSLSGLVLLSVVSGATL